jgi:hypothetical protein
MSQKYAAKILEAIHHLNETGGSDLGSIHKYVHHQHPECESSQISIQLQKLESQGTLEKAKRHPRYMLSKKYLEKLESKASKGSKKGIKSAPVSKSRAAAKKANKASKKKPATVKRTTKKKGVATKKKNTK